MAWQVASELAAQGVVVVSGLAAGIDDAAHRGAMVSGGRTIALIGTPLDRVYPKRHAALQQTIHEQQDAMSLLDRERALCAIGSRRMARSSRRTRSSCGLEARRAERATARRGRARQPAVRRTGRLRRAKQGHRAALQRAAPSVAPPLPLSTEGIELLPNVRAVRHWAGCSAMRSMPRPRGLGHSAPSFVRRGRPCVCAVR
jgi:hypothetical protein